MRLNSDGTGYVVVGIGTCTEKDLVIPSTYNGLPIVEIGEDAFAGYTGTFGGEYSGDDISSIVLPDTITKIGTDAFYNCYNLISVQLSNNLTSIGSRAFRNCSIESISIPDTVINLGNYVFEGCSKLKSVYYPCFLKTIPRGCFAYCSSLKSFSIPNKVEIIKQEAFSYSGLLKITIPDSVRII